VDGGGKSQEWSLTFVEMKGDEQVFSTPSGKQVIYHASGSSRVLENATHTPHSGFVMAPLTVGQTWTHSFTSTGGGETVQRVRECVVADYGPHSVKAGAFDDVFVIECTNQRTDRPLPRNEKIYFSAGLGREIRIDSTWADGSYRYELIELDRQ